MLDEIQLILPHDCKLSTDQTVLVAVSGGPDSLCLLDILHRLGYPLVVAHLNHGLRPESQKEADLVREAALNLGAPFCLGQVDVRTFAAAESLSIEEAGRLQRYGFLFKQAAEHNAQAVATGHTADDQVETVLMHLLRGAGLAGLRGMAYRSLPNTWSEHIPLVRPLLGVWRSQIEAYLSQRGLLPTQDASNLDKRFYRNRLRHELIPTLETYNPRVRENLWRTAQVLGQDYAVLADVVKQAWEICVLETGVHFVALDARSLQEQPLGVQRYLVRWAINHLRPGLRDIDFSAVERALSFLQSPSRSGGADLVAGLRLLQEGERLWLASWQADLPTQDWPQLSVDAELDLDVPGRLTLPGDWEIKSEILENVPSEKMVALANTDPFQAWLDLDTISIPLQVRARHPGDRMQPLGMGGKSLKVSDLMINLKLPARARPGWPLVCSAGEIIWAPGLCLADPFRVREGSNRVVHLRLERRI